LCEVVGKYMNTSYLAIEEEFAQLKQETMLSQQERVFRETLERIEHVLLQ
jgi:hypothetical protein